MRSSACGCIGLDSVKKEIKKSDLVGVAIVNGIHLDSVLVFGSRTYVKFLRINASLERMYKGPIKHLDRLNLITGIGGGDCGFLFQFSKKYIIYAKKGYHLFSNSENRISKSYYTDICTRTKEYNSREIELINSNK